jgi:hypothetical protein
MAKHGAAILALGLALGLAACGGDPMKDASQSLANHDLAKAEVQLAGLVQAQPDLRAAHMQYFVLLRYLALQGAAAQQDAYQNKSIGEYDWLVKSYGLTPDYRDMEGSLKANPQAGQDLTVARRPIYGQ